MFDMQLSAASWVSSDSSIFGILIGLIIVFFIISILLAVWVYRDAEARGKNGALWLIILLLAGLIGLIIWLIVRPKEKIAKPK
jgi:H+/Cl- antiporter ClcA